MEEKATLIESLFERTESYVKTNIELVRLKAISKSADLLSALASSIILSVIVLMLVIMLNIGLALWIGDLMGKSYYGFFTVALFYLVIGLVLFLFQGQLIKKPIGNAIITNMLKEKENGKIKPD